MVNIHDRVRLLQPPTELDDWRAKKQLGEYAPQLEVPVPYSAVAVEAVAVLVGAMRDTGIQNTLRRSSDNPVTYLETVSDLADACVVKAADARGLLMDGQVAMLPAQLAPLLEEFIDERVWGVNYG